MRPIAGWWKSITAKERKLARDYLCDSCTPDKDLYKCFISLVMRSSAKLCVIPMQDYMGLDNSSRMNQPSTVGKNWKWRILQKGAECEASERDPWYCASLRTYELVRLTGTFVRYIPFKRDV